MDFFISVPLPALVARFRSSSEGIEIVVAGQPAQDVLALPVPQRWRYQQYSSSRTSSMPAPPPPAIAPMRPPPPLHVIMHATRGRHRGPRTTHTTSRAQDAHTPSHTRHLIARACNHPRPRRRPLRRRRRRPLRRRRRRRPRPHPRSRPSGARDARAITRSRHPSTSSARSPN